MANSGNENRFEETVSKDALSDGASSEGNLRSEGKSSAEAAALTVGEPSGHPSPKASGRTSRAIAWCVMAVAVVAIGVCGWFILSPSLGGDAVLGQGLFGGVSDESAASEEAASQTADGDASGDTEGASESVAKEKSNDGTDDGSGSKSTKDSPSEGGVDSDGGDAASAGDTGNGSGGSASSSSGNASSSQQASSGSSSQGSSAQKPSQPSTMTVTVSIDSSVVGSPVSLSTSVVLAKGATVYDALLGTGVAVDPVPSMYGIYVRSIGGLAEEEASGWTYYVNGEFINESCSSHVLSDGDVVTWVYVNVIK